MKGLEEELRVAVQLFRPRHLVAAMNQARLLENTLEVWGMKGKIDNSKPNQTPIPIQTKPSNQFTHNDISLTTTLEKPTCQ